MLTIAAGVTQLVDRYLLRPYELEYLRLFALDARHRRRRRLTDSRSGASRRCCIACSASTFRSIATNCAVLGVALINTAASRSFVAALFYGDGRGARLRAGARRCSRACASASRTADVPIAFRGAPITFVTAGILSLAFMAFAGFARL